MNTETHVGVRDRLPDVVNQIVSIDPKILVEDNENPNEMTGAKIKRLSEVIKKYGFLVPIIIDTKGNIIDGHQRAKAAAILKMNPPALVIDTANQPVDKKFLRQWMNKFRGQHDPELDIQEIQYLFDDEVGSVLMEEYMDFKVGDLDEMRKTLESEQFETLEEEANPPTDKKRRIVLYFTSPEYEIARKKLDALSKKYGAIDDSQTILELLSKT